MDITYLGAGSVKLSGKSIDIVCDPFPGVKTKADVTTWSAGDDVSGIEYARIANSMLIDGPGEYEVKETTITGAPAQLHIDESGHRGTAYSFVIDGINVVVTGNISGKLEEAQLEKLGQVDVLVVPVGGGGLTLDAEGAAAVVAQLEPSWVVPVHYNDGVTQYPVPQADISAFLKEMGSNPEPVAKLKLSQKEPPAETQVVVLERAA